MVQGSTGHEFDVVIQAGALGMGFKEADYEVVFKNGPLGFTLQSRSTDATLATVKTVTAGGQAAQGGVTVNDTVVANDMGAKNIAEVIAAMNTKPRPLTIPFRRGIRPTSGYMYSL